MPTALTCRTVFSSMIQWRPPPGRDGAVSGADESVAGMLEREPLDPDVFHPLHQGVDQELSRGDLELPGVGVPAVERVEVQLPVLPIDPERAGDPVQLLDPGQLGQSPPVLKHHGPRQDVGDPSTLRPGPAHDREVGVGSVDGGKGVAVTEELGGQIRLPDVGRFRPSRVGPRGPQDLGPADDRLRPRRRLEADHPVRARASSPGTDPLAVYARFDQDLFRGPDHVRRTLDSQKRSLFGARVAVRSRRMLLIHVVDAFVFGHILPGPELRPVGKPDRRVQHTRRSGRQETGSRRQQAHE